MNNTITIVIGGCRSGKSSYALYLANQIQSSKKIFIATSVPADNEMKDRVIKHQKERGRDWITAEVPIDIPKKIKEFSTNNEKLSQKTYNDQLEIVSKNQINSIILVDCLTLWLSNLMFNDFDDEKILDMIQQLQDSISLSPVPIFLVSNEVGMGIVPDNALSRRFRDMAGILNQRVAVIADQVFYMAAGIPMKIKP